MSAELCSDAGWGFRKQQEDVGYGGQGGASRFFKVIPSTTRQDNAWTTHADTSPGHGSDSSALPFAAPTDTSPTRMATPIGSAGVATPSDADTPAAPFLYQAKAPKRERPVVDGIAHPTVKPLALMRWLVRLVTPPGGTVLEPFAGSGTTVEACILEGVKCVAIEKGDGYLPLIVERIQRQDRARIADEVTRRPDPAKAIVEQVAELGLFDLDDHTA